MSLLYKHEKDVKYSVEVKTYPDGKINLLFTSDCGKFGTDEILQEHELTVKQLLQILQKIEHEQCAINGVVRPNLTHKHPVEGVNETMQTDNDIEEVQLVCNHPSRQRDYYRSGAFKCWKCKKIVVAN